MGEGQIELIFQWQQGSGQGGERSGLCLLLPRRFVVFLKSSSLLLFMLWQRLGQCPQLDYIGLLEERRCLRQHVRTISR